MRAENIQQRVLEVVREVLALDKSEPIDFNASIREELAESSLDQMSLFMALEDEFDNTILEEDLDRIKTVADIVSYIEERIKQ